jgi:hypothetical protein
MGVNDRNVKQILQRLADDPAYAPRFAAAFPQDPPAGRPGTTSSRRCPPSSARW